MTAHWQSQEVERYHSWVSFKMNHLNLDKCMVTYFFLPLLGVFFTATKPAAWNKEASCLHFCPHRKSRHSKTKQNKHFILFFDGSKLIKTLCGSDCWDEPRESVQTDGLERLCRLARALKCSIQSSRSGVLSHQITKQRWCCIFKDYREISIAR